MLASGSGRRVVSRATTRPESAWEPPAKRFPHRQHQFFPGPIFHYSPTPRRRSVLHGPRRLRLTAALKIDDAVVMCGLEDRSGRVDALEDRGQSPPRRLGAKPRDHLCGAGNIGQIGALDRLTPGLTRPRMRVAGFGEVGFRLCLGHRLGPRLKPVRHRSVLWGCNAARGLIRHQPPPGYVLRLSDFPLRTKEVPVFTPIRGESDNRQPPYRFGGMPNSALAVAEKPCGSRPCEA